MYLLAVCTKSTSLDVPPEALAGGHNRHSYGSNLRSAIPDDTNRPGALLSSDEQQTQQSGAL